MLQNSHSWYDTLAYICWQFYPNYIFVLYCAPVTFTYIWKGILFLYLLKWKTKIATLLEQFRNIIESQKPFVYLKSILFLYLINWKAINTTLSEQFKHRFRKIVDEEVKWIPLTHIYITTHFHGLVQTLKNVNGVQYCFHMFLLIFIWCCLAVYMKFN